MFLIVGLGNYGRTYERTRHNAGFDVLEILSRRWGIPMDRHGRKALYGEGSALGNRVVLAQPQTYMNLSGDAVVALSQWYHLPPENVIVVYDDVDLPIGRIRMRSGGSAGTHNGMRDIQLKWGQENFPRVRVGIGRPLPGRDIKDHVLTRVGPQEQPAYQESLERAADAVCAILERGMIWAQDHFNGTPKPEKPRRERGEARPGKAEGSEGTPGAKPGAEGTPGARHTGMAEGEATASTASPAAPRPTPNTDPGTESAPANTDPGTEPFPASPDPASDPAPTQTDPGLAASDPPKPRSIAGTQLDTTSTPEERHG